ncbi:hypothetical protein PINS_up008636 [Pythium insidiosum]|nr:hypothetical protein PINS_up008636 [Pythium insidiosum]
MEDDARTQRLAALDTAIASDEPPPDTLVSRQMAPDDSEAAALSLNDRPFASAVNLLLVISPWTPPREAPSRSETPVESEPAAVVPTERPSRASVAKVDPELEASRRREALAQVERFLGRTSRCVIVDQLERVPDSVLLEMSHLALLVYAADPANRDLVGAVRCATPASLPREMALARELQRQSMEPEDRLAWMVATRELALGDTAFAALVARVRTRSTLLWDALQRQFFQLWDALKETSDSLWDSTLQLDSILHERDPEFQATIDGALRRLPHNGSNVERLWTDVEVALGDVVEQQRLEANAFVQQQVKTTSHDLLVALRRWIAVLPLVILELREATLDVLDLLQSGLYERVSFLASSTACASDSTRHAAISTAVSALEACCQHPAVSLPGVGDEIQRLLTPITSHAAANDVPGGLASLPALHQHRVSSALMAITLDRVLALLSVTSALFAAAATADQRHLESLQQSVARDLRWKNEHIATVMASLRSSQRAQWSIEPRMLLPQRSLRLTTHHRSQFLSARHLRQWMNALRASSKRLTLKTEDVVAVTLEVANAGDFPRCWRDATAVASVAMRWSVKNCVAWRSLVYSVLSRQYGAPMPSASALEKLLMLLPRSIASNESKDDRWFVSTQAFESLPLWFDDASDEFRLLLTELFQFESVDAQTVDMTSLLLTLCAASAQSENPCTAVASVVFPDDDKGLRRASRLLQRWPPTEDAQILTQLRTLCKFADVEWDDQRAADVTTLSSSHDPDALVVVCRAYDPVLVSRFILHETFHALVDG